MSGTKIEVSYAPTNRATCKGCKQKIEKDSLRISLISDALGDIVYQNHYHKDCFKLRKSLLNYQIEDIDNLDKLKNEDQDIVKQIIETQKAGTGTRTAKKAKAKKQQQKQRQLSESESDDNLDKKVTNMILEPKVKTIKALASKTKKKVKGEDDEEQQPQKQSKSKKQVDNESEISDDSDEEIQKFKAYTDNEQTKYETYLKDLQQKTIAQLKEMLKKNDQKCTGTKPELIDRIADAKTLGCIPRCPKCNGGRPQFNKDTGKYKCPGFMDDTVFRHCNSVFSKNDIERIPWLE